MKRILFASILGLTAYQATTVSADTSSSGALAGAQATSSLVFVQPRTTYVDVTAGGGTYAATTSMVYVRVHTAEGWSSWKSFAGIEKGETKSLSFTTYGTDSLVDEVSVWVGSDGARLTLELESQGTFYNASPEGRWIKNGSANFTVAEVIYDGACCASGEGESGTGCTPVNTSWFACEEGSFKLDCDGTDGTICVDDVCECCHDCA